jgi:N-acetylglucosaminyldiphosphoundecaprenol N-acetyl-beta-D-mannosaminyltransferase
LASSIRFPVSSDPQSEIRNSLPLPPRYNVLGIGISALTLAQARDLVLATRGQLHRGYICLGTAHGLTEAQRDAELRRIYNESFLTTPDGMPLVWLGPPGVERVYGPDLMLAVCDAGRAVGLRHFLYGGVPGVAEELRSRLVTRFPGLEIAGTFTPPFRPLDAAETADLRAAITRTRPDIIWVGLSSPKQEKFMVQHWRDLDAALLIGVGAAFDFHSGRTRQAPRWIQRSGFEWLFRLCTEPRRLGPRYLKTTPLFALRVLAQRLGLKKYPQPEPRA